MRVEIVHAGRTYVACRYLRGRVELYLRTDGLDEFMRYAQPNGASIDRKALRLLSDVLDPAAMEAKLLLSGAYGKNAEDVQVEAYSQIAPWGAVTAKVLNRYTGQMMPRRCSIKLYSAVRS